LKLNWPQGSETEQLGKIENRCCSHGACPPEENTPVPIKRAPESGGIGRVITALPIILVSKLLPAPTGSANLRSENE